MSTMTSGLRGHTAKAIYEAAVELFYEQGYRATTLRQIANRVGVQVGSLYNYITSKERLLFDIMRGIMIDLVEGTEAELAGEHDPLERIHRFMRHSIRFHGERQQEVFIGNTELRSLSGRRRQSIVDLRDRYEAQLHQAVDEAVSSGQVTVPDVHMASFAGLAICTHVATWYRKDGSQTLDEIAENLCATYAPLRSFHTETP